MPELTPNPAWRSALPAGQPQRRRRLQHHLVMLVLIALLPVAVIGGIMVSDHARQAQRFFRDRLAERSASVALALDREIEVIGTALAVMATNAGLRPGEDRGPFIERARAVEAALGNVLVVHDATEATDPATPAALRQVFIDREPAIARPADRGAPSLPGLPVYEPVIADGEVIAVLEMGLTEAQIATVLAAQNRGADALALVLDPAGIVVSGAGRGALSPGGNAPAWLTAAHAERLRLGDWPDGAGRVCAIAVPDRARFWQVVVCESQDSYDENWLDPLRERAITLLASLALGIAAAIAMARRLARPLAGLTEHARAVAAQIGHPAEAVSSPVAEFEALRISVREAQAALRIRATAEHLAMLDARTTQRLLASVINGVTEGIDVKSLDGCYVMMNQAARASLGIGPDAGIGATVTDLMPAALAAEVNRHDAAVLAAGTTMTFELQAAADGVPRLLALTKTPWRDATGAIAGVVTVARDVTEARAAETRLRALQADLLRTTRLSSMGAMASGLAHEINQPLAAASNFLSAALRLADHARDGDPEALATARSAIAEAAAQTLRAGAIVRRLRDFVERGEAALRPEDIGAMIAEACALAHADGADGGIALSVAIANDTGSALVDRTQMQQVLLNLIRNAAEAIASHPGAAPGRIAVAARRDAAGRVHIEVADNGPGLDPAIAPRLFQPFVSTKRDGLGIGLAICHTIVVGHGGDLTQSPAPGGGTIFDITLPPPVAGTAHAA